MTQAATIDAGATLELSGAASGSITFKASTGNLVLDHAAQFTGTLVGLTGDGTASNSNHIDLKDIAYGSGTSASFSGTAAGGVLTVVDAQNHAAHLSLIGDYTRSTFNVSSDGTGGTLVIDPPKASFEFASVPASQPPATTPTVTVAGLGSDGFVFDQATSFGDPHSFATEAFNGESVKVMPVTDISLELPHVATPVDAHFSEFHNFMLH